MATGAYGRRLGRSVGVEAPPSLRALFDRLTDEQSAPRLEDLAIPPGVAFEDPVVAHLGRALLPALERPEETSRLVVEHLALALVAHLAHRYGGLPLEPKPRRGGLAPWQERRAKELLAAHLDGEIALAELARACGLSRSHFARAFKVSTGLPPHRWLLALRVERAQDLLLSSTLTLAAIAEACGFADQRHFTRIFAGFTGTSPGAWRRSRRA